VVISERSHAVLDEESRLKKIDKIVAILGDYTDLPKCKVLDVGTGSGHIAHGIAKHCSSLISVDVIDERKVADGYSFNLLGSEHLPFDDNSFDVVISNHVIEHLPDQKLHIREIARVLKKEGILYLATPNRFWIIEPHYKLPILSWFPMKIASFYLKAVKNKKYDIYPLSLFRLKKVTRENFEIYNMNAKILRYPHRYKLDGFKKIYPILSGLPMAFLSKISLMAPSYILILKNRK
jgi:ubiquinone/menaquinone biosynthesis C-methylase UbiE